ncbi:MAG: FmdB family transcriptional regulator [Ignavibacteria bacterium]
MPTYHYVCKHCNHELEELQAMNDPPLLRCPKCGTDGLARTVGTGAGLIFKGSGFYLTDYVKKTDSGSSSSTSKGGENKDGSGEKGKPSSSAEKKSSTTSKNSD